MFGMSRELHSELKSILEKRSSERPDSIVSSEMSYQEVSPLFVCHLLKYLVIIIWVFGYYLNFDFNFIFF